MLIEPVFHHARSQPDDISIIDDRGTITFGQLAAMVAGLCRLITAKTQRQNVGLLLPNGAGFVSAFYATLLAGKTVVPINYLLGARELQHIVKDSGIDLVLTAPPLAARMGELPADVAAGVRAIDLTQLPPPTGPADVSPPPFRAESLAVIMYTSGTSGLPKGVMLSYGNLASDVHAAIAHATLQGKHAFLGILPLFHSTGLMATMIAPMTLGSRVVYMGRFSPVATVKAIREHQLSIVAAVPSMYGAMIRLKDAGKEDLASLYAAISGGEPLSAAVRDGFQRKFAQPIYEGYGLTETIGPIAFNVPAMMKPGSVGRLIPGARARIVDDDGADAAPGTSGEVWLAGPMIMQGYWNLPAETAAALTPDGQFKSGDLGCIDSDGYLHITGRKKDLIIVAGEKAVPREIEEILMAHPAVAEAAVLGKKDASRGEVVVAFLIAKPEHTIAADAIREFCRQRGLMQWKIPREIFVVNELPHSPTGKVLKRVLAERLAQPAQGA